MNPSKKEINQFLKEGEKETSEMKKQTRKVICRLAWFSLIVFLFSVVYFCYEWITSHILWFLIISGSLVVIFVIIGILSYKTAWKKLLKKIKNIFD